MAKVSDAPAQSSDASIQEAPRFEAFNSQTAQKDWQDASKNSRGDELKVTGYDLPRLELVEDANLASSTADNVLSIASNDIDGDGIDDRNESPTAVQDRLATLQQQQRDLEGDNSNSLDSRVPAGQDSGSDLHFSATDSTCHNYGWTANINEAATKFREQLTQSSGGADAANLGVEQLNAQALASRALSGDASAVVAMAVAGIPSQGVDRISIYDLKMHKDSDGQVVLLAPVGDSSNPEGLPLLRNDGRPVSAMELGQYLRPDGTILMGEQGLAYRPSENFSAIASTTGDSNKVLDSRSVETSLVSEKNELASAAANLESGAREAKEKFGALRSSKSEVNAQESIASNANDSTQSKKSDLLFEPKQAAEQQRLVKTRLGETLRSIAVRDLGDVNKWIDIATKNDIPIQTKPDGSLFAAVERGTVLALPTAAEIENFQARASLAASLQLT